MRKNKKYRTMQKYRTTSKPYGIRVSTVLYGKYGILEERGKAEKAIPRAA